MKNTKIAQMRKRLEESKQQVYNLTHQIEQEEFDRLERTHQMGQVVQRADCCVDCLASCDASGANGIRQYICSLRRQDDTCFEKGQDARREGCTGANSHHGLRNSPADPACRYNLSSLESSAVIYKQSMKPSRRSDWSTSEKRCVSFAL